MNFLWLSVLTKRSFIGARPFSYFSYGIVIEAPGRRAIHSHKLSFN